MQSSSLHLPPVNLRILTRLDFQKELPLGNYCCSKLKKKDSPSTKPLEKTLGRFHRPQRSQSCLRSRPLTPHSTQEDSDHLERHCTICYTETQLSSQLLNSSEGFASALWQRSNAFIKNYLTKIILPFFNSAPVLPYATSRSKLQSLANHFKRKSSFMFWISVNLPGWSKIIVFII